MLIRLRRHRTRPILHTSAAVLPRRRHRRGLLPRSRRHQRRRSRRHRHRRRRRRRRVRYRNRPGRNKHRPIHRLAHHILVKIPYKRRVHVRQTKPQAAEHTRTERGRRRRAAERRRRRLGRARGGRGRGARRAALLLPYRDFSFPVEHLHLPAEYREVVLDVVHHRWRRYHLPVRVGPGLLVYSRRLVF